MKKKFNIRYKKLDIQFKKINIQMQFFLTYITIAVIVITIFSVFFYTYVSQILIERETSNLVTISESFMEQTDAALHTMDDVSLNIGYSNLVIAQLNEYFKKNSLAMSDMSDLVSLFVALNGVDYRVAQINVYGLNGLALTVGPYTKTSKTDLSQLDWVAQADEKKGFKTISLPYQSNAMLNNTSVSPSYFSLYRQLYDSYGRHIGYVETVQTCKKVFKGILSYQNAAKSKDRLDIYVYNENGSMVYPYEIQDDSDEETIYDHYYQITSDTKNNRIYKNPITGKDELITSISSSYSGWTFVCAQEEAAIIAPVKAFSRILIFVVILVTIVVLLFSYLMSKSLTRPIHQLLKAFHKTKIDTLGFIKKDSMQTSFNEFDELNDAFYQMSTDLKTSMDDLLETRQQELKSRSLALQSQINPHLYYNSLSSIMVLAENGQTQEVISFSKNLTSMMRYITHGNMQIVTLLAEINYIKKYLYCMKIRHQSSLTYNINIDSALDTIEIPKLLIQPLVENALKYGTECEPPWSLNVESEVTPTYWLIHISDSGPGFTDEALALIESRFSQAEAFIGMPETKIDGLGMLNVYLRWRLFCKGNSIFRYSNKPEGGSIVSIGRYTHKENKKENKGEN